MCLYEIYTQVMNIAFYKYDKDTQNGMYHMSACQAAHSSNLDNYEVVKSRRLLQVMIRIVPSVLLHCAHTPPLTPACAPLRAHTLEQVCTCEPLCTHDDWMYCMYSVHSQIHSLIRKYTHTHTHTEEAGELEFAQHTGCAQTLRD